MIVLWWYTVICLAALGLIQAFSLTTDKDTSGEGRTARFVILLAAVPAHIGAWIFLLRAKP